MEPRSFEVELLVDRLIPYLLVLLLLVIGIDIFWPDTYATYLIEAEVFDVFVILVFGADLYFKYRWARRKQGFVQKYWVDILAIIPFFLVFRVISGAVFAAEEVGTRFQRLVHLGAEAEKEVIIIADAERIAKIQRLARVDMLARLIRPIGKFPRFLKAFEFYEHPLVKRKRHAKR